MAKVKEDKNEQLICQNRKARHEYLIIDTIECGILLVGSEIKSIREHNVSLDGSYASITNGEIWLIGSNIDLHKNSRFDSHDPKRNRKLLLHRKEIDKFGEKALQKGYTLIPLKLYLKDGRAKIELAVGCGKKQHDKRQAEKEKDVQRELRRYS